MTDVAEAPAPPLAAPVRHRRPRAWTQALVIAGLLWVYDAVNNLAAVRRTQAFAHAYKVLRLEEWLHLEPERAMNTWLAAHRALGSLVGDYYDVLHFVVTLTLVGWLWWARPGRYRRLRNALVGINLVGFVVFWAYPLAPPRMLGTAGFVDVVAVSHAVGAWSSGALASQANEFAAMPSLHVAWAVWCALAVPALTRRRWVRVAAWAYPVVTSVAVIATANHYLLDVVAGLVTALAAYAVSGWWDRRGVRQPAAFS